MDPMLVNSEHPAAEVPVHATAARAYADKPASVSELERLASAVMYNREAMRRLESKLHVVSDRQLAQNDRAVPSQERTATPHIRVIIDELAYNNQELERLNSELVL